MNQLEVIKKQATRDAQRYLEAKLNYGKGAGTQRKLIDAELKEKMKDYAYKTAFEAALATLSEADTVKKIRQKKGFQRTVEGAQKTARTVRRGANFYQRNKYWIDDIIHAILG